MESQAHINAPASTAPAGGDEAASLRVELQMRMLHRLAEIGLGVTETLKRELDQIPSEAPDEEAEGPAPLGLSRIRDAALAYSRASRAVRMAVALHSRLFQDQQYMRRVEGCVAEETARRAAEERAAEERARAAEEAARADTEYRRKVQVESAIGIIAEDHSRLDKATVERLLDMTCERLNDEDLFDVMTQPISEIIARICRDLGLDPDWPRLAEEAWAVEELAGGAVGRPLAAFKAPSKASRPPRSPGQTSPPDKRPRQAQLDESPTVPAADRRATAAPCAP